MIMHVIILCFRQLNCTQTQKYELLNIFHPVIMWIQKKIKVEMRLLLIELQNTSQEGKQI